MFIWFNNVRVLVLYVINFFNVLVRVGVEVLLGFVWIVISVLVDLVMVLLILIMIFCMFVRCKCVFLVLCFSLFYILGLIFGIVNFL